MNINTGNIYHQDKFRDTPRAQWSALLRERRMYIETQFEYDCRCIVQYLDEAEDVYAELGYDSADEMIQQELLIKPEWVRIAVTWLNQEHRVEPVTKAEVEAALSSHGGDRRSVQAIALNSRGKRNQPDNVNLKGGNQAAYLVARLRRDFPDIAAALERGEHRSTRAAAIKAGIIKPVPTVRLVADMAVVASKLRQHLTQQQLLGLINLLAPPQP